MLNKSGFTFIELMVAVCILTGGLVIVVQSMLSLVSNLDSIQNRINDSRSSDNHLQFYLSEYPKVQAEGLFSLCSDMVLDTKTKMDSDVVTESLLSVKLISKSEERNVTVAESLLFVDADSSYLKGELR